MNIYITLDYELFFGAESGTPEKCIIEPTEALIRILEPFDIKVTNFVDSGYLMALKRQMGEYPALRRDYDKVASQISELDALGHGTALHVHPHWEDSFYDGSRWVFDTSRYKLAAFSDEDVQRIVTKYNDILKDIVQAPPVAYRAGGWSVQPFEPIGKALELNGIFTDSSVYPGGYYNSDQQYFDFRKAPLDKTQYHFSTDVAEEDVRGKFEEIPISAYRVPPTFFWRLALTKLIKSEDHRPYGNGSAISLSREGIINKMTRSSISVVSIDGYKTSFLKSAYHKYSRTFGKEGNFVIIGHPKAFTPYSLRMLGNFLEATAGDNNFKVFK